VQVLLNLVQPGASARLQALAALFRRLDDLSHVLAWAKLKPESAQRGEGRGAPAAGATEPEWRLTSVELPRLHLSFEVRANGGSEPRLYCREHANLFLSNAACVSPNHAAGVEETTGGGDALGGGGAPPVGGGARDGRTNGACAAAAGAAEAEGSVGRAQSLRALLCCLPHGVVLEDEQGDLAVLVSAAAKPYIAGGEEACSDAGTCLLQRNDEAWLAALSQARHYLYPVHPSHRVLCSRTLASSLYLLLLHFAHRQYDQVRLYICISLYI